MLQDDRINVNYLRQVPLSSHHDVALFEWRRQWHWIDTKLDNDVILANLKSEPTFKLIKKNIRFASFDMKFTRLDLYPLSTLIFRLGFKNACLIARQASRCQQAFSKLYLVNLISKDNHLVFSIYSTGQGLKKWILRTIRFRVIKFFLIILSLVPVHAVLFLLLSSWMNNPGKVS